MKMIRLTHTIRYNPQMLSLKFGVVALVLLSLIVISSISIQAQGNITLQDIDEIRDIALSPDGSRLALSGVVNNQIGIWLYELTTHEIHGILTSKKATSVSWSPDGSKIAGDTGSGNFVTYQIFDSETGVLLITFEQATPSTYDSAVYWNYTGTQILTLGNNVIDVRSVADGTLIRSIIMSPSLTTFPLDSVIWDSEWQRVYGSIGSDKRIIVWESSTGNLLQEFALPFFSQRVTLSPDRTKLAIASVEGRILILEASTGNILETLQGDENEFANALSWSPNNIYLATRGGTVIRIWDIETGQQIHAVPATASFTWDADGNQLILASFHNDGDENVKFIEFPIANAGGDQNFTDSDSSGSALVTLDGSGSSDPDGMIVSYFWQEDGTEIAAGINPPVDLAVGTHIITLVVTDDDGATDTDEVVITVNSGTAGTVITITVPPTDGTTLTTPTVVAGDGGH